MRVIILVAREGFLKDKCGPRAKTFEHHCLMPIGVRISQRCLTVLSTYAPTLMACSEEKDEFCQLLSEPFSTIPKGDDLVLAGDFNARIGAEYDQWNGALGSHGHRRTRRVVGGSVRSHPRAWKILGQTLFSGQAVVAQKSWMIKNTVKIFRAILFFRASASCSKILNNKKIYSVLWIQGTLCFSGQAQLFKTPECKSIFNTVKNSWANSVFQDKHKLPKNSECKKYIPYNENFQSISLFQGKR